MVKIESFLDDNLDLLYHNKEIRGRFERKNSLKSSSKNSANESIKSKFSTYYKKQ